MKLRAIKKCFDYYLRTTTLHGAKYFRTHKNIDRLLWLLGCVANTVCAAVLCAVLWNRFARNPSFLIVQTPSSHSLPVLAACLSTKATAAILLNKLVTNGTTAEVLKITLAHILSGHKTANAELRLLDDVLKDANLTLTQALLQYAPTCRRIVQRCRINGVFTKCDYLFEIQMTEVGACCVLNTTRRKLYENDAKELSLVLNCSSAHDGGDCRFIARHVHQEGTLPMTLRTGYEYFAGLQFTTLTEGTDNALLTSKNCVPRKDYHQRLCLLECKERICGCSDPLRTAIDGTAAHEACSPPLLTCLRNITVRYYGHETSVCNCPPSCITVEAHTHLQSGAMNSNANTIDPIYSGVVLSKAVVLHVRVQSFQSRHYGKMRSESWLTVMSSFGGIFNMFMGFGLFSALEFLVFTFIRIPLEIRS